MYLRRVHLQNVRSIAELTWELPERVASAGWHVILGDNGSGKSSFLQAIALALVGPAEAAWLRQSPRRWLRAGTNRAVIRLDAYSADYRATVPRQSFTLHVSPTDFSDASRTIVSGASETSGPWFAASYGPFRRFTGGDQDLEKSLTGRPDLARHVSLFGEAVALTECLAWLQGLKFKLLEDRDEGALLSAVLAFVNQPGFLPFDVRLVDVTSSGVEIVDGNGFRLPVLDLSDGYRSILSMTFELIRQMALTYGSAGLFSPDNTQVARPGVVLIDEIDAHLHPTWQRTIGVWFRKHFPNVQFIVSTHSPLICQAAEVGSVFRLPRPGADPAEDRGEMIHGLALQRLLYGNVLDAYGTGVFGEGVTRSDSAQEKLERLAELNTQELVDTLTAEERQEQTTLRAMLPTDASETQQP
ncbi:MAG TPA: AAA family ATPase [Kofleriaceae bacterium]|nr:AAA family ATPase [Kofleriaceae bacterium]